MMLSTARGMFEEFSGEVHFDEQNPENSSVVVEIKADSINTKDAQRDTHLKSPDFLNVEQYPVLTFKSTRIEVIDDSRGRIYGDLTIRDVTREVVLDTEFVGKVRSPWGTTNVGFSATTSIDRKDWGLVWNVALETGGVLVGDKVKIDIELELIEQAEAQAEVAAV
jgi:polyisoprenoid-binding protein YceI